MPWQRPSSMRPVGSSAGDAYASPSVTTKTYYWDFFGPQALGTAAHFSQHLTEFLVKNRIADCVVDTVSDRDGHSAARCVAPEGAWSIIEQSLRPRRSD